MNREEYLKLRKEKDFLYKYFVAESMNSVPYSQFYQLLGLWLTIQGISDDWGVRKIAEYLDKKHEI